MITLSEFRSQLYNLVEQGIFFSTDFVIAVTGHAKKIKADPEVLEWGRTLSTEPSAASPHTCGIKVSYALTFLFFVCTHLVSFIKYNTDPLYSAYGT